MAATGAVFGFFSCCLSLKLSVHPNYQKKVYLITQFVLTLLYESFPLFLSPTPPKSLTKVDDVNILALRGYVTLAEITIICEGRIDAETKNHHIPGLLRRFFNGGA